MAARRYEISLRVLKNISRVSAANEWNIFSTRETMDGEECIMSWKKMIMLAQDSGLTRQCQQRYVKPADDSEKSAGSKTVNQNIKWGQSLISLQLNYVMVDCLIKRSCQYIHISYLCNWYLNHMFFRIPSSDRQVSPSSKYKKQHFQRHSCQFFLN